MSAPRSSNPKDALFFTLTVSAHNVAQGVVYPDEPGSNGDDLLVLPLDCPTIPGEQDDDGVRAIAAIDGLRYLLELYEEQMS